MAETGKRPAEVAQDLGISTSTLRRWSQQFGDFLSAEAGAGGNGAGARAHRRYSDEDVEALVRFQGLLQEGLTYEEARRQFANPPQVEEEPHPEASYSEQSRSEFAEQAAEEDVHAVEGDVMAGEDEIGGEEGDQPLVIQTDDAPDVAQLIASTLSSLSDSQQIILGSQQTERQLLGVLLQDNFNLKEENIKIRDRMVEAERKIFELKREYEQERGSERERMRQMESNLFEMQRRLDGLSQRQRPAPVTRPQPAVRPPTPAPPVQTEPVSAPKPTPPAAPQAAAPPPEPLTAADEQAQPSPQDDKPPQATPAMPEQTKSPPKKRGFWDWLWGRE